MTELDKLENKLRVSGLTVKSIPSFGIIQATNSRGSSKIYSETSDKKINSFELDKQLYTVSGHDIIVNGTSGIYNRQLKLLYLGKFLSIQQVYYCGNKYNFIIKKDKEITDILSVINDGSSYAKCVQSILYGSIWGFQKDPGGKVYYVIRETDDQLRIISNTGGTLFYCRCITRLGEDQCSQISVAFGDNEIFIFETEYNPMNALRTARFFGTDVIRYKQIGYRGEVISSWDDGARYGGLRLCRDDGTGGCTLEQKSTGRCVSLLGFNYLNIPEYDTMPIKIVETICYV